MHVISMFATIEAGSPPNVGRQIPKQAKSHSHCPLNNNSMNGISPRDSLYVTIDSYREDLPEKP